jgi:hypothetical protein
VAVGIDKTLVDLASEFKEKMRNSKTELLVTITAGGIIENIVAHGAEKLPLTHPTEIVIRRSEFVSDRTLAVHANKAAGDLSRKLVQKLQNPLEPVKITMTAHG